MSSETKKDGKGSKPERFTLKKNNEESFCQTVFRAWAGEGDVSAAQGVEGFNFFY